MIILENKIDPGYIFKGTECVRMQSGKYSAVIAPKIGSAVLRMRDEENGLEIFKYREDVSMETISQQREIWGLPTLYLPNRFDRGVLKTSDNVYHLPVNETLFDNHIHGWVHKREHEVVKCDDSGDRCVVVTRYVYDKNDEMYEHFPIDFTLTYTYTLSGEGLKQELELVSNSDKKLPVSICTHTCFNAPLKDGGNEKDMRLCVPIGEKCELNERCLPTEKLLSLNEWDKEYKDGTKVPTGQALDNDMYTAVDNSYEGRAFNGCYIKDTASGHVLFNEVSKEYAFWNMWNDQGMKGYFCPEPMTAMINAPNLSLRPEVTGYAELSKDEAYRCWQRFYTV